MLKSKFWVSCPEGHSHSAVVQLTTRLPPASQYLWNREHPPLILTHSFNGGNTPSIRGRLALLLCIPQRSRLKFHFFQEALQTAGSLSSVLSSHPAVLDGTSVTTCLMTFILLNCKICGTGPLF